MKLKRCPSGKRRYRDHEEAFRALRKIKARNTREKTPVRTYDCNLCAGYHLTSQWVRGHDTPPR